MEHSLSAKRRVHPAFSHLKISSATSLPVSMVSSITSLPPSRISSMPSPIRLITSPESSWEMSLSRSDDSSSLLEELSSRRDDTSSLREVSAFEVTAGRVVVMALLSSYLPTLYSESLRSPAEQAVIAAAADSAQIVTARYLFMVIFPFFCGILLLNGVLLPFTVFIIDHVNVIIRCHDNILNFTA